MRSQPLRLRGQPFIENVAVRFVFARLYSYFLHQGVQAASRRTHNLAPIALEEYGMTHLVRQLCRGKSLNLLVRCGPDERRQQRSHAFLPVEEESIAPDAPPLSFRRQLLPFCPVVRKIEF